MAILPAGLHGGDGMRRNFEALSGHLQALRFIWSRFRRLMSEMRLSSSFHRRGSWRHHAGEAGTHFAPHAAHEFASTSRTLFGASLPPLVWHRTLPDDLNRRGPACTQISCLCAARRSLWQRIGSGASGISAFDRVGGGRGGVPPPRTRRRGNRPGLKCSRRGWMICQSVEQAGRSGSR